jgi:hypothetical protein
MLNCFFHTSSCITENTSTTVQMAKMWDSFTSTMTAVNCPMPFLWSKTLYLGSILRIFRMADPISISYIVSNLKLPLILSLFLWLSANTHRQLPLSYRSAFPCRNICTQYFVYRVSYKWRCNFLLGLSTKKPTACTRFPASK